MTNDARSHPDRNADIARLRAGLAGMEPGASRRNAWRDAADRLNDDDRFRERQALLAGAREQAARIASLLELVSDVGDVSAGDPDLGVFADVASLFDDVAAAAALGAAEMRALVALRRAAGA